MFKIENFIRLLSTFNIFRKIISITLAFKKEEDFKYILIYYVCCLKKMTY